jgi:hypothetical protein
MSTSAGIKQYAVLDDKLGSPSAEKMHRIIADGGDLFGMMAEADLSVVDRQAFQQLLFPAGELTIPWTPVAQYVDKIRAWNKMRGWGLTEKHIGAFARKLQSAPHAGDLLPTSVTLTLGKGLDYDWNEAWECIEYELRYLNGNNYGIGKSIVPGRLQYFEGSESKRGPYLAPAKLDLHEFYYTKTRLMDIRSSDRKWPGTEVLWLLALNPQIVAMTSSSNVPCIGKVPTLIMAGLNFGNANAPTIAGSLGSFWDFTKLYQYHTVVSFRS